MYDDYSDSGSRDSHSRGGAARDYYEDYESGTRPHRTEYHYYDDGRSAVGHRTYEVPEHDNPHHHSRELQVRSRSAHTNRHSSPHHHRHRDSSLDSRHRKDSRPSSHTERYWEQAAGAAIVAGAIEAFRVRNEHGQWTGSKGARVATAAFGAAAIDAGLDRDPEHHAKRHVAEAAVGGLIINRVANGPRDR